MEFIRVYETAIEATEGDVTMKVKSVTLVFGGVVLTWFTIPSRSIYAWEHLWYLIRNNFQGNYAEPEEAGHLFSIKQAPGESLCSFFKKSTKVKC